MSYVSTFVHTQPTAKIVVTESKPVEAKAKASVVSRKETVTKILLFTAIMVCLVLAVTI